MTNFAIWIGGTWTVPPASAMPSSIGSPVIEGGPIVRGNDPTARDGFGAPCGVDDELFVVVGRTKINATGMAWWYDTVGIGSAVSKQVAVRLWDMVTGDWTAYSATMWQPTFVSPYAGYKVTNFSVRFTNLEPI